MPRQKYHAPAPASMNITKANAGGLNAGGDLLADNEALYLGELLVDRPNVLRCRGPVKQASWSSFASSSDHIGMAGTINAAGAPVILAARPTVFLVGTAAGTATGVFPPNIGSPNLGPYWNESPCVSGGVMVGASDTYTVGSTDAKQHLFLWKGATAPTGSSGTLTCPQGTKVVTFSAVQALEIGMYIFATGLSAPSYLGCIASVDTTTQVTLEQGSFAHCPAGTSFTACAFRQLVPQVTTGLITFDGATGNVTGAGTKFASQGMASGGDWYFYRASDHLLLGNVNAAAGLTDLGLVLGVSAAATGVKMDEEEYVAIQWDVSQTPVGWITASYANRQFYANKGVYDIGNPGNLTDRLWFSGLRNPDSLDLSKQDGDWLRVTSHEGPATPIMALVSCYSGLLIIKQSETFLLSGQSPETFSLRKIADVGTLNGATAVAWNGGAVWAGADGIYQFDGTRVDNIIEHTMGATWRVSLSAANYKASSNTMRAFIHRDHYFLGGYKISPAAPTINGIRYDISGFEHTLPLTPCINLRTRGLTNIQPMAYMMGSTQIPDTSTHAATTLFVVQDGTNAHYCLADADDIFSGGGTAGDLTGLNAPYVLMSKWYDFGQIDKYTRRLRVGISYEGNFHSGAVRMNGGDDVYDLAYQAIGNIDGAGDSGVYNMLYTITTAQARHHQLQITGELAISAPVFRTFMFEYTPMRDRWGYDLFLS